MNKLRVLKHEKGHVYLLATKRNTRQSIATVKEVLAALKPHVVAIEMCLSKLERFASIKKLPSAHALDLIPQRLKSKAFSEHIMLDMMREALTYSSRVRSKRSAQPQQQQLLLQQQQQQLQQHPATYKPIMALPYPSFNVFQLQPRVLQFDEIGREAGVIFGRDVWQLDTHDPRFLLSANVDYQVMLAGKPMADTLQGIADALTHDEVNMLKVYMKNFTKLFVENSTDTSIITHILHRNPRLRAVLGGNRNEHMAKSLAAALNEMHRRLKLPTKQQQQERQPLIKVLAVVKAGRLSGILKCWLDNAEGSAKKRPSTG